jgi:hypothetical protein
MKIHIGDHHVIDIEKEAKIIAKENGFKVKDIDYVRINHKAWGIALSVWGKNHQFIGNEAC